MKKVIFLFVIICFGLGVSKVEAKRARIQLGTRQVIKIVYDLPDTKLYQDSILDPFLYKSGAAEMKYYDLAVVYDMFYVMGIPAKVQSEPTLVLYGNASGNIYDYSDEDMKELFLDPYNLDAETIIPKLTFYEEWGGKLLIILIILVISTIIKLNNRNKNKGKRVDV